MRARVLLFDLDGTLLQSDKTISANTLNSLQLCREKGFLIGVATSRSEKNSLSFISELCPDIIISSGGAVVKYKDDYIYLADFTVEETQNMIKTARSICGDDCEITIDTIDAHYWNYKIDPTKISANWGESVYSDFTDFSERSLKMCVEIFDPDAADALSKHLPNCDCIRFSDGHWYKFTQKAANKENAILILCDICHINTDDIIAFGDDWADIGMLQLCGVGVAMGNSIDEVKSAANIIIGSNDEDGISDFLRKYIS